MAKTVKKVSKSKASKTSSTKLGQFDGKKAMAHVEHLAVTIGPRFTGTAGEHKAADYIAKTFKSFKLATKLQKFTVDTFDSPKCSLKVLDGKKWRDIAIEPIGMSGSTPAKGFTGEFYYAESGEAEYFSDEMTGKIVLVCGNIGEANRYKFLAYKPKALIIIEGGMGVRPLRMNIRDEALKAYGKLPMGRILHLDGVDIVNKNITKAKLTIVNTRRKSHSSNVIGELKGTDFPDEVVVICGHYDTSRGVPGALDNAAGTALVMELARVLALQGSKRTLRFIAFAAEETGLVGSKHYATELLKADKRQKAAKGFNDKADKTELTRHVLTYNIDVHGAIIGRHGFSFSGHEDIGAAVRLLAKEIGMVASASVGPMSSDGSPLAAIGIPALQFARGGGTGGYLHSPGDDIRLVSAGALEKAGVFSEILLRRYITQAVAMPFPREIPEDQKKKLAMYKVRDPAQAAKDKRAAAAKKAGKKVAKKAKRRSAK